MPNRAAVQNERGPRSADVGSNASVVGLRSGLLESEEELYRGRLPRHTLVFGRPIFGLDHDAVIRIVG